MISDPQTPPAPKGIWWTGAILTGLVTAFLLLNAVMKLLKPEPVVKAFNELGWVPGLATLLGIIQLCCLSLYLIPRTSVLGAVLWTGYLGGAIATHVRVGSPLFSHTLFPVYIAALIWGGLVLRRPAVLRLLFPKD
ncbi:MAG: DoxX family protein [Verrucomicrobiota bacterium]